MINIAMLALAGASLRAQVFMLKCSCSKFHAQVAMLVYIQQDRYLLQENVSEQVPTLVCVHKSNMYMYDELYLTCHQNSPLSWF